MTPRVLDDVIKKVESSLNSADKSDKPNIFVQKLAELKKLPPSQQMAVSSLVGFGSGYTVGKFGQVVVITSLATGAVLYYANQAGYVNINWGTLKDDYEAAKEEVHNRLAKYVPNLLQDLYQFANNNKAISGGAAVGFLIGLKTATF